MESFENVGIEHRWYNEAKGLEEHNGLNRVRMGGWSKGGSVRKIVNTHDL